MLAFLVQLLIPSAWGGRRRLAGRLAVARLAILVLGTAALGGSAPASALDLPASGDATFESSDASESGDAGDLAEALGDGERWNQVRIEQRLIIRITPRNSGRDPALAQPPPLPQGVPLHLRERKIASCLPVAAIASVRPLAESRIMLLMRDNRLVGADLSRTCMARDFYMGFYMAPTGDGQLCVDRDTIHSRAGTTCTITRVRELLPDN